MKILNNTKINQPEGLCHMWYECTGCKERERIWNSRPRVTPFAVPCRKCNATMHHVDWNLDEFDPNYVPKKGERIFVDYSREALEKFRRKYIEDHWESENKNVPAMKSYTELWKTKEEALQYFMDRWRFGQPTIETI